MYIDGQWTEARSGATFEVTNPATGEVIGTVPDGGADDARDAVAAADAAFGAWAATTAFERARLLYRAWELMVDRADDLAALMTTEQGKPLRASRAEVNYGADFLKFFAEEATRVAGEWLPSARPDQRFLVLHQPVGVVAAITPTTNPTATIINNTIAVVSAGNGITFNVHPNAKRVSVDTIRLLNQAIVSADGPQNLVTCIAEPTLESAQALMEHPKARILAVTGGPGVVKAALATKKRAITAGPGNPPVVVDASADIGHAGAEIVRGPDGADPASVAYETLDRAVATGADVVLLDTAGRLHTQKNLMQELAKVQRVLGKRLEGAPHHVWLVLDGTNGQNAIQQAREFTAAVEVTGLIVSKLDGTARGGVLVALGEKFSLPIHFIGVGEGVEDLQNFVAADFASALAGLPHPNR